MAKQKTELQKKKIRAAKQLLKRHGEDLEPGKRGRPATNPRNFIRGNADSVIGEKRDYAKTEDELAALKNSYDDKIKGMLEETNTNTIVSFLNEHSEVLEEETFPLMEAVVRRAARSFPFFSANFLKVTDADTEEQVPFVLNAGQRKGHVTYLRHLRSTGRGWMDVSKTRQIGFTTYTNGRALHHGLFYKNAYIIIMASKQVNSDENLKRIREMFKNLPGWFLNNYVYQYAANTGDHKDSASRMEFDSHWTQTRSTFVSASANGDSVRGHQPNFVHWTETAFCEQASSAATAIMPALRKRKGSTFIVESTSNGMGNWYADLTLSLDNGEKNDFCLVFIPWFDDISNNSVVPDDWERTKEEDELAHEYNLTDSQLAWRRNAIASDGGDVQKFNQEYPYTVKSSFLTSDDIFYSEECMEKVFEQASEAAPVRYEISADNMVESSFGTFLVYKDRIQEMQYVLSVDASAGTPNGDYTVITVVDAFGEMVAQYRDRPTPDEAAAIINRLGRFFNNAAILVEREQYGTYIISALVTHFKYPTVFRDKDGRLGWKAQASKFNICAELQDDILNNRIRVPSIHLHDEMQTFVVVRKRTLSAKEECYDDVIISTALAYHGWRLLKPRAMSKENQRKAWDKVPRKRFAII